MVLSAVKGAAAGTSARKCSYKKHEPSNEAVKRLSSSEANARVSCPMSVGTTRSCGKKIPAFKPLQYLTVIPKLMSSI